MGHHHHEEHENENYAADDGGGSKWNEKLGSIMMELEEVGEEVDVRDPMGDGEGKVEEIFCGDNNSGDDDEARDPLNILPEEVWEYIMEMLKHSPKDLMSCCRASLSWDFLLSSGKRAWIFGEALPLFFAYLSKKEVLHCRRVCKQWKLGVDNFLENHSCHIPAHPDDQRVGDGDTQRDSVYFPLVSKQLFQIRFIEPEQMSKFRVEMERSSSNPIVGRSVSFYSRDPDEWMMNALHFLSAFGRHIWYFAFESLHAPLRFIQWLRQCLTLLPNLQRLHIISLLNAPIDVDNEAGILDELLEDLRNNPMPPLPFLNTLEICTHNLPRMIQDTMMTSYAGQVHRLQLNEWNEIYASEESYPLGHLTELNLTVDSNDVLKNLLLLNSPLITKLSLTIRHQDIDIELMFKMIQRFASKLRVLKITLSPGATFKGYDEGDLEGDEEGEVNLYFPQLKVLVLVNLTGISYDFLLSMESLEYLYIETWSPPEEQDCAEDFVQLQNLTNDNAVYNSNVWEVLPHLKHFTYSDLQKSNHRYTRQMYQFMKEWGIG